MSSVKELKTVKEEVTVAWRCDACGVQTSNKEQYEQEWHHFSESHQSWGNDSGDSWKWHDVCSVDCFTRQLQKSIPDLMEYADSDAEIAEMPVRFAQKLLDRLLSLKSKEGKEGKDIDEK
jgi:hypothetical protein